MQEKQDEEIMTVEQAAQFVKDKLGDSSIRTVQKKTKSLDPSIVPGSKIPVKIIVKYKTKHDKIKTKTYDNELLVTSVGRMFANAEWSKMSVQKKIRKLCTFELANGMKIHNFKDSKTVVIGVPR